MKDIQIVLALVQTWFEYQYSELKQLLSRIQNAASDDQTRLGDLSIRIKKNMLVRIESILSNIYSDASFT